MWEEITRLRVCPGYYYYYFIYLFIYLFVFEGKKKERKFVVIIMGKQTTTDGEVNANLCVISQGIGEV